MPTVGVTAGWAVKPGFCPAGRNIGAAARLAGPEGPTSGVPRRIKIICSVLTPRPILVVPWPPDVHRRPSPSPRMSLLRRSARPFATGSRVVRGPDGGPGRRLGGDRGGRTP